jgi:hypothetical protein
MLSTHLALLFQIAQAHRPRRIGQGMRHPSWQITFHPLLDFVEHTLQAMIAY